MKKEDLQAVWRDIGMPCGHAYGKSLRTVKTCVGSEWCRFGTQDSSALGRDLERALWRMYAPHKVKLAVSGCPRNCAESGIKDVGVIGVDSGWEIYVAGNGGIKTEVAQFFTKVKTAGEVLEVSGAFLQLYREEGWYLERTVHYVGRVGLDYVKKRVLDDAAWPPGPVDAAAVRPGGRARPLVRGREGSRGRAPVHPDRRRLIPEFQAKNRIQRLSNKRQQLLKE
ncbi:nitrite reductase (NAD(P)H), large subunit [Alicycliphilus sp. B1]|nr:nitrite reductase (NAD(P)H), large subunit [Alicycliphilus sp. B1]